jgi:hypothetical protein
MSINNSTISEEFRCTGAAQTFQVKFSGVYLFEVYGAQGGGSQSSGNTAAGIGGKGGYASGKVHLEEGTFLYVYVGCVGSSSNSGIVSGGFNGGGYNCGRSTSEPGNGGGGASDVRLVGGAWDNPDGLLSRIIVAGGGGGGGEDTGETGGYGGGITGGLEKYNNVGSGGVFGKGAHSQYNGGGGGGGWIGGNAYSGSQTIPTSCVCCSYGGNGGSGYVYTSTSERYQGYSVPSKYQMSKAILTPNVNEGNGRVKISINLTDIAGSGNCRCTNCNRASFITSFALISLTGIFILQLNIKTND